MHESNTLENIPIVILKSYFFDVLVLRDCDCTPFFHTLGARKCPRLCHGPSLLCMNKILDQIGEYREVEVEDKNSHGKKRMAKCLEACEDQQNEVAVTSSRLPNRQTMLKWSDFCIVMEKLKKSCSHVWKRIDLDRQYPSLCPLLLEKLNQTSVHSFHYQNKELCIKALSKFDIFGTTKPNKELPKNQNKDITTDSKDEKLLNALFLYARENLALVNIYIKPPVVTRIMKDERIPVIWFVANCGGILGLCMGFSIVTVFEVLHYFARLLLSYPCTLLKSSINSRHNQEEQEERQCKRSDTTNSFLKQTPICNYVDHEDVTQM